MKAHERASWTAHLGDLAATVTGPMPWAAEQRATLGEFLAGPVGSQDLGTLRLDVHIDELRVTDTVAALGARTDTRRIRTIPGVEMIEATDGPRARVLAVAVDGLEHAPGTYAVRITDDHIELLVHHDIARRHRLPLRILREAMIRSYENAGATLVHAAGASVAGVGIMICGPRTTGKTTALAALLAATRGDLLSNDRVLLQATEPTGQLAVAVPLPVPLARGTIDAVTALRAALGASRRSQPRIDTLPRDFGSHVKAELTAQEFATAFGGQITPSAPLGLIVAPRLSDTDAPLTARSLMAEEIRALLDECCFTPHDEFWLTPWLIKHRTSVDTLSARSRLHIADIAATTPGVEICFGVRNPFTQLADGLTRILEDQQ